MSAPNSNDDLHKLIAEIFLSVQRLEGKLDQLELKLDGKQQAEGWAEPIEAAAVLKPEGVKSPAHLKALRLEGAFSEARGEIRGVGKGKTPRYEYYIPKCRTALARHFKRRAG